MKKEIFTVAETVKFIRVRNFAEGYKGKYAVCEGECNGNSCKIFVADEEFPLEILNKIDEGTFLKVNPNDRGLRAVKIEYQDLEIIKLKPLKKGKYPYVCTFPGHWRIMQGYLTVK